MASIDDYKVPSTQGCSGYDCSGEHNQKNEENESSVSKKNFSTHPEMVPSDAPCKNTEENDEKEMPTRPDSWKDAEKMKRLDKDASDQSSGPLHAVNPQQPKNGSPDKGGGVPPTQGCYPKV